MFFQILRNELFQPLRAAVVFVSIFAALPTAFAFDPNKQPARLAKFWGDFNSKTFIEKVALPAPPELIDYIQQDNKINPDRWIGRVKRGFQNSISKKFTSTLTGGQ